jgi:PAS domain S-box-containing protein
MKAQDQEKRANHRSEQTIDYDHFLTLLFFAHMIDDVVVQEQTKKVRIIYRGREIEVGIFRTRLDGSEVLHVNDRFLEILGYERWEIIGKPLWSHWFDPHERDELVHRVKAEGKVENFKSRLLDKQGNQKHCLTTVTTYKKFLEGFLIHLVEQQESLYC